MHTKRLRVGSRPTFSPWIWGLLLAALLSGGCGQRLETTDPSDDTTDAGADADNGNDIAPAPSTFDRTDAHADSRDTDTDTGTPDVADTTDAGETSPPDVSREPVRVSLQLGDRPVPGATVVFHDGEGQVLGHATTDAEGRAAHAAPDGAMVTYGFGGIGAKPVFRTVTGVQSGESLAIRVAADETPSTVGTVRVNLPPPREGADSYEVSIGCNSRRVMPGTEILEMDLLDSCPNGGEQFDVVARAFDGDTPLAYAVEPDVTRTDADDTRVALTAWNDDWIRKPVDVVNASRSGVPVRARLGLTANDQYWQVGESRIALANGGGRADFSLPPGLGDSVSFHAGIWETKSGGQPHVMSIVRGQLSDTSSAPITVDLQTDLLPLLRLVGILQRNPERPTISWSAYSSLSEADVGVAVFTWTDEQGNKQQWHAYVPPTQEGNVRFPKLPDLYDSLAPVLPSSFKVGVAFVDRADIDDYADLRESGTIETLGNLSAGTRARITRLGFF